MNAGRRLRRRDTLGLLLGAPLAAVAGPQKPALPAERLQAAADYSARTGGLALLVREHGRTRLESGAACREPRRIYSGTKAFWGLAALAAIEDELIKPEEPVAAVLSEWRDRPTACITHLLDFSCGLAACPVLHEDGLDDRNRLALQQRQLAKPGQTFIYGPSALQVFHEVLKRRLAGRWRRESPVRYLERRVLRPLDLGPQRYLPDGAGNPLLAAGFLLSAEQWAAVGDLMLKAGRPVLRDPAIWSSVSLGSAAGAPYRCGFWNNRRAARDGARETDIETMLDRPWQSQTWTRACLSRSAPADLLACVGSGGQRLYAVPSQGLIVVRQGRGDRFRDPEFLRRLLA